MGTGPDAGGLNLQLFERVSGSLAKVRETWPESQVSVEVYDQAPDLADLLSREKVQMVICDMTATDPPGFQNIQTLRRIHPDLPVVAVLPQPSLALTLTAFRGGATDVLIHPLEKATLLEAWGRISARLQQDMQKSVTPQTALVIENKNLVGRLQEKNRVAELAHAALVKLHDDRTRFVCNLSHELKAPLA